VDAAAVDPHCADIAKGAAQGPSDRRGISVEIDWGRRHFACSIELRRLLFWFIMLLALAPIKSLTLGGSPPPQRSVVSGLHRTPAPVAASLAASLPRGCDAEMALGAAFANNSDTGVAAINQHVTCSSLDELSLVILREACGTVGGEHAALKPFHTEPLQQPALSPTPFAPLPFPQ
jgi:hypothetical protein